MDNIGWGWGGGGGGGGGRNNYSHTHPIFSSPQQILQFTLNYQVIISCQMVSITPMGRGFTICKIFQLYDFLDSIKGTVDDHFFGLQCVRNLVQLL